jgi:hypothetical protein
MLFKIASDQHKALNEYPNINKRMDFNAILFLKASINNDVSFGYTLNSNKHTADAPKKIFHAPYLFKKLSIILSPFPNF